MSNMDAVFQAVGEEEYRRVIMRSVVGLCYTARKPESGERIYQHASGFLLAVEDEWLFMTAGHVLTKMEALKRAGWTLDKWHLDDSGDWPEAKRRIPAPFTFNTEDTVLIDIDREHDYAAIRIRSIHRAELTANGKVPLTEEQWRPGWHGTQQLNIKAFCMVGVPAECVEAIVTPEVFVVNKHIAHCEVLPLLDEDVPADRRRSNPSFYGRIEEELKDVDTGISVKTINGMSGAPIFALHLTETGELGIRAVAIQSAWYPKDRIVIGSLINGFPDHVMDRIRASVADTKSKSIGLQITRPPT